MRLRLLCSITLVSATAAALPSPAAALPTMIRLGYTNCAACHIAPQGGGPLNDYGRGIDEAQSRRGGEYKPAENGLFRSVSANGRIRQDLRLVMQQQTKWNGRTPVGAMRARIMFRAVADLGGNFRFAGTVTGENEGAARPSLVYEPAAAASHAFVNTALLHYRASNSLEIAVGRDQLPTGINVPDLGVFIKSRNRLGYYDAPAQLKAVWSGDRFQVMPFVYGGGSNESRPEQERGAGSLAELDIFGNHTTVLGTTIQHAAADNGDRNVIGAYARAGFGRWGILAEHDVTNRHRDAASRSFRQDVSYAQVFWAARDWLVASGTGERLRVDAPFREHLTAGKAEIAARFTSHATVTLGTRVEHNAATGRFTKSVAIQLALKTVD